MALKIATFSTWVSPTVYVEKGQLWPEDDAVVTSHPDWFVDPESPEAERLGLVRHTGPKKVKERKVEAATTNPKKVEATTAVPGEKRTVRRDA